MDIGTGIITAALALAVWLAIGAVGLALFAFWVWMLVDCLLREFRDSTTKLIWALVIVFVHFIGALIYLIVGRSQGTLPAKREAAS